MYILKSYSFTIILLLLLSTCLPAHAAFRISNNAIDTLVKRVLTANAGGYHELRSAPKKRGGDALGILSLVFGIISFLIALAGYPFLTIPAAIILGIVSVARARKNKGLAIAGIALAVAAILVVVIQHPGTF